jgi:hemerythrin superfamily protein
VRRFRSLLKHRKRLATCRVQKALGGADDMDVFEELIRDHRVTEQQFAEIEQATDKEVERREQLFRELRARFEAHEVFEEETLYPEIGQLPSTKLVIGEGFEAHAELDAVLQEMAEIPADKPEWIERIRELKEMMREHVRTEEETIFPAARTEFGKTRAEELGRQFQKRTSAF